MEELHQLRKIYHLKNVERCNTVKNRKESSAEHSWSCLILADYFLSKIKNPKLNRLKVYELLLYHDVVEIEAGDLCINRHEERKNKKEKEFQACQKLQKQFPPPTANKFAQLFQEYEEQKTPEAHFCKAIDYFDAELHELDYKKDWQGWTEEFLREKKKEVMKEFPELDQAFEELLAYAREKGYFNQ